MLEAYPNRCTFIADLYYAKDDVAFEEMDVIVKTGSYVSGMIEVDKMSSSYSPKDVIGLCAVRISATYADRKITVGVKGPMYVKVAKATTAGMSLKGDDSAALTEYFSGDESAQQEVNVGNVPINTVTSFTEDPEGTPTVLTRVAWGTAPSDDEYSLNDDTGVLIIGGDSTSGTDNYELIYTITETRLTPVLGLQTETVTVTTNVGTLDYAPKAILAVTGTAGFTAAAVQRTTGSVATGEVTVDYSAKTLTFAAGDSCTECEVLYIPDEGPCAIALNAVAAGEICEVYFNGVKD